MSTNLTPARDRNVSVARTDGPLTIEALRAMLIGREAYRHTSFIAVRSGEEVALVAVTREEPETLFAPIADVRMVADSSRCVWVDDPETDTSVPSQLAAAARDAAPSAGAVVVAGRYGHVGFIVDPRPIELLVIDVVPPFPPKLGDQVRRVMDTAEDLPPMLVREQLVDLRELATQETAETYLLPCRAGNTAIEGHDVRFLDERPEREPWALIGCARSRELHRWFYGDLPVNVDSCPRERVRPGVTTLTKCCLLDAGVEVDGASVTVAWGASLAEVRTALERVVTEVQRS